MDPTSAPNNLVNERIKLIRSHLRLQSKELAARAGISSSELSLVEKQLRNPKLDTLQKLAAALDVSVGYLIGEEDNEVSLPRALSRQSLKVFVRRSRLSDGERAQLETIVHLPSAPKTADGWRDFLVNMAHLK